MEGDAFFHLHLSIIRAAIFRHSDKIDGRPLLTPDTTLQHLFRQEEKKEKASRSGPIAAEDGV